MSRRRGGRRGRPRQGGIRAASAVRFEAVYRRGTELLLSGEAGAAILPLEEAVALAPDHVEASLNLSGALILTKRFKAALPLLEALADRAPGNPAVWQNLGAALLGNPILAQEPDRRQAIEAFKRALELNPTARHVAYNIGLIYRDQEELAEAIAWFGRALIHDPADDHARQQLVKVQERLAARGRGEGEEHVLEEE